jgi:hypothetical protein
MSNALDSSDMSSSSLENLSLYNLPKLAGWWRMREAVTKENEQHHHLPLFPSFPCLSYLFIRDCPMMSLIPAVIPPGREITSSSSSPFSDLSKFEVSFSFGIRGT